MSTPSGSQDTVFPVTFDAVFGIVKEGKTDITVPYDADGDVIYLVGDSEVNGP